MHNVTSPVSASVRAELARARISGRQLAADLGWQHQYMARRLAGTTEFRADELITVAAHLGVPVARFFESAPASPAAASA